MAVTLAQFLKHLTNSGVMPAEEIRALQASLPAEKLTPDNCQEFVRELVRLKKLTPFQATEIYKGQHTALVLGNYVLLDLLGQGGMGTVYKAEHRRMKRVVALKVMSADATKSPATVQRFRREVQAAARLDHPNIVTAHDADEALGTHFLVMQFVEGTNLSALVKAQGPLNVAQGLSNILQAARGLAYAHSAGVVHRDIKPANLLLDRNGTVKILDMGLARLDPGIEHDAQSELTSTGAVMGTVDFMSPEQAVDTKQADARSDVYSLGCTLFYLLTGKTMYSGDSIMKKLLAHRDQPVPRLTSTFSDIPEDIDRLLQKMVAKRPDDRYQTMAEVVAALESWLAGTGISAPPGSGARDVRLPTTSSAESKTIGSSDPAVQDFLDAISPAGTATHLRTRIAAPIASDTFVSRDGEQTAATLPTVARSQRQQAQRRKRWFLAGGGIAGLLAVAAGAWSLKGGRPVQSTRTNPGRAATGDEPQNATPADIPSGAGADPRIARLDPWRWQVASLQSWEQIEAIKSRLKELNRGFDGKLTYNSDGKFITELSLISDQVTDLSPLKPLVGLQILNAAGSGASAGKLESLKPLRGLLLTHCNFNYTMVNDLAPLEGMPLEQLSVTHCPISDLSPLSGMPLKVLQCSVRWITDLGPLEGLPLEQLDCTGAEISDLSPLKNMQTLKFLSIANSHVSDISPLAGLKLINFACHGAPVGDFSPLRAMPLTDIIGEFKKPADHENIRAITTLERINGKPAAEFWKEVDAEREK